MKKIFQLAVIFMALVPAISFGQTQRQIERETWTELKTFNTLITETFSPIETGNYTPLKQKAEELFRAARAWQRSVVPANFKPEKTKMALRSLTIQCGVLHKAVVAQKPDAELKTLITKAHNTYHTLMTEYRTGD